MSASPPKPPVIAESLFDAPSQRLYALSFGVFLQALKALDVFSTIISSDLNHHFLLKWILIDVAYLWFLPLLRIPRLTFLRKYRLLQILIFVTIDWLLLGDYKLALSSFVPSPIRDQLSWERSVTERLVRIHNVVQSGSHLLGQHTVRMSPISTARLNPYGQSYCLGPPDYVVLIPIVTNNTKPSRLHYSIAPLGDRGPKTYIDVTAKELKSIESSRAAIRQAQLKEEEQEDRLDELFGEEELVEQPRRVKESSPFPPLEKTEAMWHIRVNKPGFVQLERGFDMADSEIRIGPTETMVVQCPMAEFADLVKQDTIRCVGSTEELSLKVYGVTPLTLKWYREVLGRRQPFMVDGIEGNHEVDRLPLAQELRIPLSLSLDAPGKHKYNLDALIDGVGNTLDLSTLPKQLTTRSLTVLKRASMSFKHCGAGRLINLFKGTEARLAVVASEFDKEDGPWDISIKFQPPTGDKKTKGWTRVYTTKPGSKDLELRVAAPGDYTIVGVQGKYCSGDILSPETCRVVELPLPAADIEFKRIHECSVATGVSVSMVLHGTPPFEIDYTMQRNRDPERPAHAVVHGSRGEITLQPAKSGSYTYVFKYISDANYKKIKLDGPTINQVVHRLASAEFADAAGHSAAKTMLSSCSGSLVDIPVNLDGTPPWNLEIQVVGPKETKTFQMPGITKNQEIIHLPIPPEIDQDGGTFQVDLVSVEDANGCKRSLAVKGLSVNVKRLKPTAKFYATDGRRQTTILEGKIAQLPLRLTGEGPWEIVYRHPNNTNQTNKVAIQSANENIAVKETGVYELLEVRDSHCPGSILPEESTYLVDWVPKPVVRLSSGTVVSLAVNGSYIRPPICEYTEDHVDLDLKGRPPFQISYNVARDSDSGGLVVVEQPIIHSIQTTTRVPLRTTNSGRVYYEVSAVGDSAYPLEGDASELIPVAKRLQFEQEVLPRPSAFFKTDTRLSYCLTDQLVPRPDGHLDNKGLIVLDGRPPFTIHLSIKNIGASETHKEVVRIEDTNEWKLNFPDYIFNTVGPHLVTIDQVTDSSGCPENQTGGEFGRRSIWIDVAETAMIVPYDRREVFCVGDVLQFQLEGTPPWRIKYRFNGKLTTATAKSSTFRRVAESPGLFSVVSIAHQQNLCQTTVSDVKVLIHDIPSALVSHGKKVVEDIKEGDQAEIVFTLVGEPPFTFTYQRTELERNTKRGKHPKVLETHTVSGVMTHEYSIYSALEGTWTVSFISDKYCRYPPVQPDSSVERA